MFELQRFLRLANAHWAEHRREYAWFIGVAMILQFVLVLILFADDFRDLNTKGQGDIYVTGLFLTAPIFAARYFQAISRRASALLILMRPASAFEKWLLALLIVGIAYPLVYTLAFYVCDIPAWLIAKAQAQQALAHALAHAPVNAKIDLSGYEDRFAPENFRLYFVLTDLSPWQALVNIVLVVTIFQAFAVLGSLYFRAMPFLKTLLTAFIILLASIFVTVVFHSDPDRFLNYWDADIMLSPNQRIVFPIVWISVTVLLWLSCYFALREREVA